MKPSGMGLFVACRLYLTRKNLRPSFPAACSSWDKYWDELKSKVFSLFKFFYLKIKIIGPRGLPRRGSVVAGSRREARNGLAPSGAGSSQRQRWEELFEYLLDFCK